MKFGLFILCLCLPKIAFANKDPQLCAGDSRSAIFEEFELLSDEEIARRCTYDLEKHDPDADEKKINANAKRTSNCEKGMAKMREISERYVAKKREVCANARKASTCTEISSQSSCMVDAAKLAEQVRKGQEELSSLMLEGKKKLIAVSQYNRLLTAKFRRQQRDLWQMSKEDKNRLFTSSGRINDPPGSKKSSPPSRITHSDRPAPKPAPESNTNSSNPRPDLPRSSDVSNTATAPRNDLRPQDYGARSWAEYERRLPLLLQQNERANDQLREFEEVRVVKQTEHKVAASEMAAKAAQFFAAAQKLGYAGDDLEQWKKESRALPSPVASPGPAAPSDLPETAQERWDEPEKTPNETANSENKQRKEAVPFQRLAKDPLSDSAPESPESEEPALASFEAKLKDPSQNPVAIAERSRLREILRRRMQALKNGESTEALEEVPGSLVGDILAETKATDLARVPNSAGAERRALGTVDVEGALQDIEAQLRELDIQSGILDLNSPSLFERVKPPLIKFGRSLQIVP